MWMSAEMAAVAYRTYTREPGTVMPVTFEFDGQAITA
jgi:hypothetical protein